MTPYWQSADGSITVYCARWEDVHAAGLVGKPDLIHADPPYGASTKTRRLKSYPGYMKRPQRGVQGGQAHQRDFPEVVGDERAFDPSSILALDRPTVAWGAPYFADKLPPSPSWLWWDKRDGVRSNDFGDGELAWTNLGGPARQFAHLWNGLCRASETDGKHLHPTQKPVALSTYVFQRAKLKPGARVFVPYLGSGPDLPAAQAMGLRVVACEVVRDYCDTAIGRLGAVTAERAAEPVGPLFGAA